LIIWLSAVAGVGAMVGGTAVGGIAVGGTVVGGITVGGTGVAVEGTGVAAGSQALTRVTRVIRRTVLAKNLSMSFLASISAA
jgi:hypothetical protein